MLGPGHVPQSPARPRAPPAHALGLSISKVSQARRVPPRLNEQMTQISGCAFAPQRVRCDDMGDEDQFVLGHRPARYQRSPVPVLPAYEAIFGVTARHAAILARPK